MSAVNGVYDASFVRVIPSSGSGVLVGLCITSSFAIFQVGLGGVVSTVLVSGVWVFGLVIGQ